MPVTSISLPSNFQPGTQLAFDPNVTNPGNVITWENQVVVPNSGTDPLIVFPTFSPFFALNCQVFYTPAGGTQALLTLGVDYSLGLQFIGATRAISKGVYGAIRLFNNALNGTITIVYHSLGGSWLYTRSLDDSASFALSNDIYVTAWEQYANYAQTFPILTSAWDKTDPTNFSDLGQAINALSTQLVSEYKADQIAFQRAIAHTFSQTNPHNAVKADIGLGLVANYPPATDAQAADPTNDQTYITPAQLVLAFATVTPQATDTAAGIMSLNTGNNSSDSNNATDGLTAAGFYNLASSQNNPLGVAVNHAQLSASFTPWTGTYPVRWNGSTYSNANQLITALASFLNVGPLEFNTNTGKVWFPASTAIPNMTLS